MQVTMKVDQTREKVLEFGILKSRKEICDLSANENELMQVNSPFVLFFRKRDMQ